jgi:subtilase family serine protease
MINKGYSISCYFTNNESNFNSTQKDNYVASHKEACFLSAIESLSYYLFNRNNPEIIVGIKVSKRKISIIAKGKNKFNQFYLYTIQPWNG